MSEEEPQDMKVMRQALKDTLTIMESYIDTYDFASGEGRDNSRTAITVALFRYRMHLIENAKLDDANR